MQLVEIESIKATLRIDGSDDDTALGMLCEAVSEAVVAYLKRGADGFVENGALIAGAAVPARVKTAVIYWIGVLYRNPDNDTEDAISLGYPPMPVVGMLYQMRDPACA